MDIVTYRVPITKELWDQARAETVAQGGHLQYDPEFKKTLDWEIVGELHFAEYCWLCQHDGDEDKPGYDGKDYVPPHLRQEKKPP